MNISMVRIFHDFGQELEALKQLGLRIFVNLWVVHMFYVGKKHRTVDVRKMAKKRYTSVVLLLVT